jgi:Icc-related predicted phosphoesterase
MLSLSKPGGVLLKLHVLCDLHVEFSGFEVPGVGADVVVLAGDIHVGNRGLNWILDQGFSVPVIYVLGNHEFYRDKFPGLIDELKRGAEGTNVHVLENESVELGGLRFFGCTLWTDMALFGDAKVASLAATDAMNDYRLIRNSHTYLRLTPQDTVAWHKQSVKKLQEFLEAGDPERSVVVTHASPSIKSVPQRYRNHAITPAFASNMENLILNHQPRLWIHGHTHDSYDYQIGKTRIICNPRGYVPDAENSKFKPDLTVLI